MAIIFDKTVDELSLLLASGGYQVRATRLIPDSRGRAADVYLENGVIICWDPVTKRIWVDRYSRRGVKVEDYLRRMCDGPRLLRLWAIASARLYSAGESAHQAVAVWLLRSESVLARNLRRQIAAGKRA
jgi:hypothetical protein